ncbi:cobyrinic acid a,c-diamide synthase [Jeotgalibacillus alimentarius]|uniref:Cobyrinate a,c-diamide synthase n=1 Tax=Jeotgalibacillus alimentarius TaxID=135826 RepID=A0A0C2SCE2_9BACL|nr:cobyrinate a,c-diamide synthase [Jeotgalibacillus alimentarius]KIL51624.1 cobyrinic acid a,c-diamide synthase [Jeotgalibacillus alimentarius]
MTDRRVLIAGVSSGVGKTGITIGLMAAFMKKGLNVQGFKCGPDYIDPSYHTAVTKRPSRNLDSWMLSADVLKEVFVKGSEGADISIIEGMMGLYDGESPTSDRGSAAEISTLLDCPVILIVDCSAMARSAAAVVKGFQCLDPDVKIAGVIANRIGSEGHYKLIKEAVEQECGIPVCGYLLENEDMNMPERHLGLVPSIERGDLDGQLEKLGEAVTETIDIDRIFNLSQQPPLTIANTLFKQKDPIAVKVAVAYDQAFNFYYRENLELIEAFGAEVIYFSPVNGDGLPPEADGLYIGGGFPEQFLEELSQNSEGKQSIKEAVEKGLPVLAECGGLMYLSESITNLKGKTYPMIGVLPGKTEMQANFAALGYRKISGAEGNSLFKSETIIRGHEFHYSTFIPYKKMTGAYHVSSHFGSGEEGYLYKNVVAGYTHLHFASNPEVLENFLGECKKRKS